MTQTNKNYAKKKQQNIGESNVREHKIIKKKPQNETPNNLAATECN